MNTIPERMSYENVFNRKQLKFYIPSRIGLKLNCLKCGSSVAPMNPMDALVAIIVREQTIIAGIFNNENIEAENLLINNFNDCN